MIIGALLREDAVPVDDALVGLTLDGRHRLNANTGSLIGADNRRLLVQPNDRVWLAGGHSDDQPGDANDLTNESHSRSTLLPETAVR